MGRRGVSSFSVAAEACLLALAFAMPFSLGGARAWAVWALLGLSSAALALALVGARRQGQGLLWAPGALVPAVIAAAALAQLVPLPAAALKAVSAPAAELRAFALVPLGLDASRPVSLDPPSTWREVAKHLAYAFAVLAASQVSRSRSARKRLMAGVALSGAAIAATGFLHALVNAEKLFGFYAFPVVNPRVLTPFGNTNHLAAFMTLTGTLALGLAVSTRERPKQLLWAVAFVACGAATALTGSRGGVLFFVVAPVLFAALLWRQRLAEAREREPGAAPRLSWVATAIPLAAVLAAVAVGGLVAWESLSERLASVSTLEKVSRTKVELWPMMWAAAKEFTPFGMGRGAYELAFTAYQTVDPSVVFTHPENLGLQLWSELGAPLTLLVFALAAYALGRILGNDGVHGLELAAVAALAGVALHDVFDFALEFPGTAAGACLVLGAASRGEKDDGRRLPLWAAVPLFALLAPLGLLAASKARPDFHDAEADLSALVAAGAKPDAVEARAVQLIDRHPSDYVLYALASQAQSRPDGNPARALAWVNRVLALRPLESQAHVDAARALLRLGKRSQALLEYRLAAEGLVGGSALSEGLRAARTLDDLFALVDFRPDRVATLLGALAQAGRFAEYDRVLERSLSAFGARADAAPLWLLHVNRRVEAKDLEGALASLAEAEKRNASPLGVARTRAVLLQAQGKQDEALAVLQAQVGANPGDLELALAIAGALHAQGRTRAAREALEQVSPFVTSMDARARLVTTQAGLFEAEKSWARAVAAYQTAGRLQPAWSHPHYQAARIYEGLGKYDLALDSLREAVRRDGPGARDAQAAWLERLQRGAEELRGRRSPPPEPDGSTGP